MRVYQSVVLKSMFIWRGSGVLHVGFFGIGIKIEKNNSIPILIPIAALTPKMGHIHTYGCPGMEENMP